MGWFDRKDKDKPVAKTAAELRAVLKESFSQAVHGGFFRTCTYQSRDAHSPLQQVEWLEAVNVPHQGWQVIRKIRLDTSDGPRIRQEPYTERVNLDFFTAAETLALFETTQAPLEREAVASEIESLGFTHVRAFAEREGLAFDTEGMPNPTAEGHIIGDGMFPPEAYQKARDAFEERRKKVATPLHQILSGVDRTALRGRKDALEQVERVLLHVKHLRDVTEARYVTNGFLFSTMLNTKKVSVQDEFIQQFSYSSVILAEFQVLMTGKSDVDGLIAVPLHLARFFSVMAVAADVKVNHVNKGGCTHPNCQNCTEKTVIGLTDHAVKILKEMGCEQDAELVVCKLHTSYTNWFEAKKINKVFEGLRAVHKHLEDTKLFLEASLGVEGVPRTVKKLPAQENLINTLSKNLNA